MKILVLFLTAALLTACANTRSAPQPAMQTPQKFETTLTRKVKLNYLLFLPADYSDKSRKKWPLMLFLHGAGERGTNLTKLTVHGPPKFLPNKPGFPFIVVSPQCPIGERWDSDSLLALLDSESTKYKVDPARVYVTGLSMGGYGT